MTYTEVARFAHQNGLLSHKPETSRLLDSVVKRGLVTKLATNSSRHMYVLSSDLDTFDAEMKILDQGVGGLTGEREKLKNLIPARRQERLLAILFAMSGYLTEAIAMRPHVQPKFRGLFDEIIWSYVNAWSELMKYCEELDKVSTDHSFDAFRRSITLLSNPAQSPIRSA